MLFQLITASARDEELLKKGTSEAVSCILVELFVARMVRFYEVRDKEED